MAGHIAIKYIFCSNSIFSDRGVCERQMHRGRSGPTENFTLVDHQHNISFLGFVDSAAPISTLSVKSQIVVEKVKVLPQFVVF